MSDQQREPSYRLYAQHSPKEVDAPFDDWSTLKARYFLRIEDEEPVELTQAEAEELHDELKRRKWDTPEEIEQYLRQWLRKSGR